MLSVYIWIPLAPEKTTGKACLKSCCPYISESHLHQKKQRGKACLKSCCPYISESPCTRKNNGARVLSHAVRESHLHQKKQRGKACLKSCWRMCSGSRGRVSQGHSIICVGNLQALHSQQVFPSVPEGGKAPSFTGTPPEMAQRSFPTPQGCLSGTFLPSWREAVVNQCSQFGLSPVRGQQA